MTYTNEVKQHLSKLQKGVLLTKKRSAEHNKNAYKVNKGRTRRAVAGKRTWFDVKA